MPTFRKLATLATAVAAARGYAKKNPDQAAKFVDQAAAFVDKQTKGKYSNQIGGVARKAKEAAGIRTVPGAGPAANGYSPGQPAAGQPYGSAPSYGSSPSYGTGPSHGSSPSAGSGPSHGSTPTQGTGTPQSGATGSGSTQPGPTPTP